LGVLPIFNRKIEKMENIIRFMLEDDADEPTYGSALASGLDVTAFKILKVFRGDREIDPEKLKEVQKGFNERGYIKLRSLERILFGTGVYANLPEDMELQVRARSGMALKRGLSVLNGPGTVDADYQGEIGIILYNSTPFLNKVEKGERIAQLVPAIVARPVIHNIYKNGSVNTEEYVMGIDPYIEPTERGTGSYGSTGNK